MQKKLQPAWLWGTVRRTLLICWLLMSLLSVDHLFSLSSFFSHLPTCVLGGLSWGTLLLSIVYLGRNDLPSLAILVLPFILFGMYLGPYLEPPADPLEHLRRVHEWNCHKTVSQVSRQNSGLWHYSMAGNLLCTGGEQPAVERLATIDRVHGLFWGLAVAALYILARASGLPGKWACLSVLICFLFWGTNRFSYFRYYSLAPSFSSMIIYWLWTASFFFTRSKRNIFVGILAALICLPVLWVNHMQEAVFLTFLVFIWLLIHLMEYLIGNNNEERMQNTGTAFRTAPDNSFVWLACVCFVLVLWGLPQLDAFRQWLTHFFIRDLSKYHHYLTWFWKDFYISGRIMHLRVSDTLGIEGFFMALLAWPYLWPGICPGNSKTKLRILVLGLLPFFGYLIPLFHYIWASNVKVAEYYRLCYASMFWIFFADVLYRLGERIGSVSTSVFPR